MTDEESILRMVGVAFPYLCFSFPFPCDSCGLAFPRWLLGLFKHLDSLSTSIIETNCSLVSLS